LLLLLLLSALLILLAIPPHLWLKLVSVLAEGIVEWSRVREPSLSSDKFYHLLALCDFDGLSFVFGVYGWKQGSYDFVQDTWGEAVKEEINGLFVANGVSCLSYQLFEV
jgi:hypothetical protein